MSDLTITQLLPYAPLEVGDETIQTINAKHVYDFLQVKSDYSHWIARAIKNYDFKEGRDFVGVKNDARKLQALSGGTIEISEIEYHVTFDMAKELSMLARGEPGKEARAYFIAEEKKLRRIEQHYREFLVVIPEKLSWDGRSLISVPVCAWCDTPVTPHNMAASLCQDVKACLKCVEEVWNKATEQQRDSQIWNRSAFPLRKFWKKSREVPALRVVMEKREEVLEQQCYTRKMLA